MLTRPAKTLHHLPDFLQTASPDPQPIPVPALPELPIAPELRSDPQSGKTGDTPDLGVLRPAVEGT